MPNARGQSSQVRDSSISAYKLPKLLIAAILLSLPIGLGQLGGVSRSNPSVPEVPSNNTVKLSEILRARVSNAMRAEGFTVWAEFCRVALTEKCQSTEQALRSTDPSEHARIYGRKTP